MWRMVICRLDTAAAQLEPELFRKTELNVKEDLTQLETKQVNLYCWSFAHFLECTI